MARPPIYLDYNATALPRPEVVAAMAEVLAAPGNPTSVHQAGRRAAARLAMARQQVAALASVPASAVTFTSGATEANNMAILGAPQPRLILSAIEHDSVREPARRSGRPVAEIAVTGQGVIDLASLEAALGQSDEPALVCIMAVNNETGVIQPIAEAARLVHEHGGTLHVDAVQAAGRIDLGPITAMADTASLSAHKFGGPPGVGALILRCDDGSRRPIITGGGQEKGLRAGTENLPGIAGFGVAAELAGRKLGHAARLVELRDALEEAILEAAPDAVIMGRDAPRVGNTSCIAMPGMLAETQVMAFDLAGFAVSAGSACSSGKVRRSHVLAAMGQGDDLASSAIRVSLGWNTAPGDIEAFLGEWKRQYERSRTRERGAA
jgi:cysteine desulfurase